MPMWISPHYKDTDFVAPLTLDDKITIFEDRTEGWQLDVAEQVINGRKLSDGRVIEGVQHSGFAVLSMILSYFEMIAKYEDGYARKGRSGHYFSKGLCSVFPDLAKQPASIADTLFEGARCGLYHAAITEPDIILTSEIPEAVRFEVPLVINPHRLVRVLQAHFQRYLQQLRDSSNAVLRANFEKKFDWQGTRRHR